MKDLGIVRKIDDLGRITLPIELRRTLDLSVGDGLDISVEKGVIHLQPEKRCIKCHTKDNLVEIEGMCICKRCGKVTLSKLIEKLEGK